MIGQKNNIKYISLFSGCGGFDIGFNREQFTCIGAYDIDPIIADVHEKNLKSPIYVHDLNNIDLPGNIPTSVDIVVSGSPCQGFSTIGKRKINDPRNNLLIVSGKIAIKYNAKVFICENVPGSNSGEHKKFWLQLQHLLKSNGYTFKLVKYDASHFGVPQTRKRLILYAWKSDKDIDLLEYTKKNVKLKDVLMNLDDSSNHNVEKISDKQDLLIANKILPGQKLCNVRGGERSIHTWHIPEVFGEITTEEEDFLITVMKLRRQIRRREFGDADPVDIQVLQTRYNGRTNIILQSLLKKNYLKSIDNFIDLKNTFNGKFKRLDLDSLSPTVDTRFGVYRNFLHPQENRALTVREAARIQGFSDDFIFYGPLHKQYQMVGNAVPPPLAEYIAQNAKKIIREL